MVRADISWRAKTPLHFCASNIDAQAYTNMLDATYQGQIEEFHPNGNVFEQNGAPSDTALLTRDHFLMEAMDVMLWPTKSLDLNCIEKVQGLLVRRVYQEFRHFDTIDELKEYRLFEWEKISIEEIRKLIALTPCAVV